jgi:hypothetical protein
VLYVHADALEQISPPPFTLEKAVSFLLVVAIPAIPVATAVHRRLIRPIPAATAVHRALIPPIAIAAPS